VSERERKKESEKFIEIEWVREREKKERKKERTSLDCFRLA
jgi:hypothetical protein